MIKTEIPIATEDFLSIIRDKHILIDTNVLIDASIRPTEMLRFINKIKSEGATVCSTTFIEGEFLRGSQNSTKYDDKKTLINTLVDVRLPISPNTLKNFEKLIKMYGEFGKGVELVDFTLGALLMDYPEKLFLFTKNTTDFHTDVFDLVSVVSFPNKKSLATFGIYTFSE